MTKKSMELYFYMGSITPVQNWLKEEGATNKKQAQKIIKDFLKKNPLDMEVLLPKLSAKGNEIIDNSGSYWVKVLSVF